MEGVYEFLGPDMETASEIVKDRLYFVTYRKADFTKPNVRAPPHFFNIDDQLVYANFFNDFGPLHIGHLYRYWVMLNEKLKNPLLHGKKIVHWTVSDYKKRANSAYLIGAYAVIQLKMTPREAYRLLLNVKHPYTYFQDASSGVSPYKIKIIDCLNCLNKAFYYGLVRFEDFDVLGYEFYEQVENGDMNWIVPGKLLAFSGPMPNNDMGCTPEQYVDYFKRYNVNHVVRLNRAAYDITRFTMNGINVHELYFTDGSAPGKGIVYKFFNIVEQASGAVAVHCKAGLGRTGCLIGAYLVKHYKMPADEAIAWMRICRPGCVIGHQQAWLEKCEKYLYRSGELYRLRQFGDIDGMPFHHHGIYSMVASPKMVTKAKLPSTTKMLKGEKLRKNLVMGSAVQAVGTGVGKLVNSIKSVASSSRTPGLDWSQGAALYSKKTTAQAMAKNSVAIRKKH